MIYRFIQDHRSAYCLKTMCRVLQVSQSAFYDWARRAPSPRVREKARLLTAIRRIHANPKTESDGSPRMTVELRSTGLQCSEARVARLMRVQGIRAKRTARFRVTTQATHTEPLSPNLLQHHFRAAAPKRRWVSDLTIILDLFDRRIVGWALSDRMHSQVTTIAALQDAVRRERPAPGLLLHSDRGKQYADKRFRKLLKNTTWCRA